MTWPRGGRVVLGGDVVGKLSLSLFARIRAAASAVLAASVEYNPDGLTVGGSGLEPEAGGLGVPSPLPNLLLIAESVVMSLPGLPQISRRPRAASRRKLRAPTDPSGKASSAAKSSRSGASSWGFRG